MSAPAPAQARPATPRVAIVIPAYRARDTIVDVLGGIPAWVHDIIVVDDACPDGTGTSVEQLQRPRVHVHRHAQNGGVGAAMRTGYRAALAAGADIIVKMDADGQMDPAQLPYLIAPLVEERADVAKGNRFGSRSSLLGMPWHRMIGNAALTFFAKWSSGYWDLFDPCNGYLAISRAALEAIDLERLHPRYFFESSQLVLLRDVRAVISDVPMPARYTGERSHLSATAALLQFPLLHARYGLRRWIKRYFVYDFNAGSLYLLVGIPLLLWGVVFGVITWVHYSRLGVGAPTGTVVLVALMVMTGLQFVLHALAIDIGDVPTQPLARRHRRAAFPPSEPPAASP